MHLSPFRMQMPRQTASFPESSLQSSEARSEVPSNPARTELKCPEDLPG